MIIEYGSWRIAPYGSTCWQIQKRVPEGSGRKDGREWVSAELYPGTLAAAPARVREPCAMESGSAHRDLAAAVEECRSIAGGLREAAGEAR